MTISSQPTVETYLCDGVTTAFGFPYRFLNSGDLLVQRVAADGTLSILTLGSPTGYTVAGVGEDAGGTVTTAVTYADGKVRIWLAMENVQPNTYENNSPFPAQSHEDALDRLTLLAAIRAEEFSRSFHVPLGEGTGVELPPIDERAGLLWACDSQGALTFVPTVKGDDILTINAASVYFDYNSSARPRLVLDPSGAGSTIGTDIPNGGGAADAVTILQYDMPLLDKGQAVTWEGYVFRGWTDTSQLTDKHSRFGKVIQVRSQISAPLVGGVYLPQEVGALNLVAIAAAGTSRVKVEGLVVSAREEAGLTGPSKGVAVQADTTRTTQGPLADDRSQIADDDDSDSPDQVVGSRIGSFTVRCNGGTVGGVFGGYRSWSAVLASGRAGYINGVVMGKRHTSGSYTDPESVGGWGGVWGGRSIWHDQTMAFYAKDNCPGWACIGHDGIPVSGPSLARSPIDIVVDVADGTVDFNGVVGGALIKFNNVKVLGARSTGWTPMTGTPSKGALAAAAAGTVSASYVQAEAQSSRTRIAALEARLAALDAALITHGLIGA